MLFECFLKTPQGEIAGDWGYGGDDKPPWNVGPESTISFCPACFFDVPEDYQAADELVIQVEFTTASGKRFSHNFREQAPRLGDAAETNRKAA